MELKESSGNLVQKEASTQKEDNCPATPRKPLQEPPTIEMHPVTPMENFDAAKSFADAEAERRLESAMLLSWYDKDRDFESPQHAGECHEDSDIPGYVDFGINHGAELKIDIENGRFVFYYLPA